MSVKLVPMGDYDHDRAEELSKADKRLKPTKDKEFIFTHVNKGKVYPYSSKRQLGRK